LIKVLIFEDNATHLTRLEKTILGISKEMQFRWIKRKAN